MAQTIIHSFRFGHPDLFPYCKKSMEGIDHQTLKEASTFYVINGTIEKIQ
ncbi:hypothetical protein R4Z09_20930 [Niallia oryzisoli]|uniref:Uncharacterized protein n=1 Tax=Niallia oryzisoli TaxID=1737571 RepID=A0ABZ2CCI2_9BACI